MSDNDDGFFLKEEGILVVIYFRYVQYPVLSQGTYAVYWLLSILRLYRVSRAISFFHISTTSTSTSTPITP